MVTKRTGKILAVAMCFLFAACSSEDDDEVNGDPIEPTPEGELVTETIGADGGQVTSDDGKATLDFPAGALDEDTEVTIQRMSRPDHDDLYTNLYEFGPSDVEFDEPVEVGIEFDDSDDLEFSTVLHLARIDDGQPVYVPGQATEVGFSEDERILEAKLTEFSTYGGFTQPLPSNIDEACSRHCSAEEFCIHQEDKPWYEDYDHCVERCVDSFGENVSAECLEVYGHSVECLDAWSCSGRFDEYALPAGGCSGVLWGTVSECSAGHLVPDDPAFIADLSVDRFADDFYADGPDDADEPDDYARLLVVWDLSTDSQFRTGKFEKFEAEFERIILHDDEGGTVDVEFGDVSGDLIALGPPPADQTLTVAWNLEIPIAHYTDIETVVNPIEIIDADQNDRTADFAGVPDMPVGRSVSEGSALVLRYMPAALDIDGDDVTLGVHVVGDDEPEVWAITGPWKQTLGFPRAFENWNWD